MTPADPYRPVAVTRRSGVDESVHHGAVVGLDRTGAVALVCGDPGVAVYPRSSCKPLQAVSMLRAGLVADDQQLALACASHDGTPRHRAVVESLLASVGLGPDALANTPDLPIDPDEAAVVLRAGGGRTSLQQNCSGKHAAMLATAAVNGWPVDPSYLDPDHPLQQAITATLPALTGGPVRHVGVDGCGAPAHVLDLIGVARAVRAIATGEAGGAGRRVHAAMTSHPELVGGARRDVTVLMRAVPGLMAKDGAEGVFAAALPDGRAVALKVADGASRARPAVMVAALAALGVEVDDAADRVRQPVLGHGRPVGEVRCVARFDAPG